MFLKFVLSRLLCGRREQCGHCDRLTISKMPKETSKTPKSLFVTYFYPLILNGEFIELTLINIALYLSFVTSLAICSQ